VSRSQAAAASFTLAAALVGVALGARAGTGLERTSTVELLLVATSAALVCAALIRGRGGRLHGAWAVAAFAALAALTALSVSWSIAPDLSYVEAGRTFAYLAVFAGAVAAARLAPTAAPMAARGVLLAAVAIAAYGLAARIWPGAFSENGLSGRIGLPFDYWNALAGVAAVGIPLAVWLGARRNGGTLGRALAYPAAGLLIATVLIAQSRGALLGAAVACAIWVAFVPLRLRSLGVLAIAGAGAAPVTAWALSKDAFRGGVQPASARDAVAGDFGLLLVATLLVLFAAGLVVEAIRARRTLPVALRVRSGVAIAAVAAIASLGALTSVAVSDRGLGGTVSDRVDDLTGESAPPVGGARLGSTSSSRAGYWDEAWSAFDERPAGGLGAGSFQLAHLTYRDDGYATTRAHGFVPETLSGLGIAGLLVALALLAAWLVAAARTTGIAPRRWRSPTPWTTERAALVALALAAVAYGVQSAVDWTWFVPGLTVMALVAAGFVAGRGPLTELSAVKPATPRLTPARALAAGATVLLAALAAWAIWQPASADDAVVHAYELIDDGDPQAALEEAESARDRNPYSAEPLYAEAAALAAQDRYRAALLAFRQAAEDRPRDPQPWVRIATFALHTLDSPQLALEATRRAHEIDPYSQSASAVHDRAQAVLAQRAKESNSP
jgi:hypothetical protein